MSSAQDEREGSQTRLAPAWQEKPPQMPIFAYDDDDDDDEVMDLGTFAPGYRSGSVGMQPASGDGVGSGVYKVSVVASCRHRVCSSFDAGARIPS